ncbi:uncharacterized protein BT62DRAFT_997660 [Guyanagaster necrorhizus]|uniref:ABC1 atypical kinase-like domain-containing protein n=1 Tax=Guyanagaster necrorhizus TaxID=856835 RepID=A0A9P7VHD5_9AGAR|nr:uncharacterized protein BT62DRAFT_997660 [Guyanagaster necrorhizus MCA 3950]KAG7440627.1 hypothetical protein BT62DRAFT_997660 [Guyanagaster necrorhizus MCA 3950]
MTYIPLGQDSTTFRPLVAKIVKRLEPFTSSVLLIQQVSDGKQFMLKLNDRRLGHHHSLNMEDGKFPWTTALEEHLRAAVQNIQLGTTTNWFDLIKDWKHPAQPDLNDWEGLDVGDIDMDFENGRTLNRGEGISFIAPTTGLFTDYIPCLIIEYIQGVSMGSLKPGVDIPRPEAEALAGRVMDAFRTMKTEKCVMHNDIHIDNILLRDSDRSPVLIDFGWTLTRKPGMNDEEWENSVSGSQNTRFARRVLMSKDHGVWRRKGTPVPMNYYYSALMWNEYVRTSLGIIADRRSRGSRVRIGKVQEKKYCSSASSRVFSAEMTRCLRAQRRSAGTFHVKRIKCCFPMSRVFLYELPTEPVLGRVNMVVDAAVVCNHLQRPKYVE